MSDGAHRPAGDARHHAKQVPRLGISVKYLGDFPDPPGQSRCGPGQHLGYLGKSPPGRGSDSLGYHRKKLAGSHADQRQEVLRGFLFALRFSREFAEVLHHRVWIDFADGADLFLVFLFAFVLVFGFGFVLAFAFAEEVAEKLLTLTEQIAEKILAFQFLFGLVLEFIF
jgi:hypothetical protein